MDFTAAFKSGLTQSELAKVLGVSRVTVNLWLNGKMKPHRLHTDKVKQRMGLLAQAVERGLIPKPVAKKPRHEAIEKALQQVSTVEQSFA